MPGNSSITVASCRQRVSRIVRNLQLDLALMGKDLLVRKKICSKTRGKIKRQKCAKQAKGEFGIRQPAITGT